MYLKGRGNSVQHFYTVRSGETVAIIAQRWQIPISSLIAANNLLPPYTIYVGQQLSMPPGVDLVRVNPGDSIYKIAQVYGIPQATIIDENGLTPPYTIQVGQLIRVPRGVPYYVVQAGDTLYEIARRYQVVTGGAVRPDYIQNRNNLPSDLIYPGMRLVIPYAPPGGTGRIAFTSNVDGSYDLWVYDLRNGAATRLTNGLGESFTIPFWSHDQQHIAFVGKHQILYIVNVMNKRVALIDQFRDGLRHYLDWSPDGQSLAYSKDNEIIVYHYRTHTSRKIPQMNTTDVQWFPNNRELLFQGPDAEGISQLYIIDADGVEKRQITRNTGGRYNDVRLSNDGKYVLYTTPGASVSLIFTIELDTGRIFEVKGGPLAKNYYPEWSNQNTIAYSATAYEDRGYFSQIRTVERTGENDVVRAISNCFSAPLTWSQDGSKVAYLSGCFNQGLPSEIWLTDLFKPVPIRLISGGNITALQWSPQSSPTKMFVSETYLVAFSYPGHWVRVLEERYEGRDGFFQVSAISSDSPLSKVCRNEAFHELRPYGTNPSITSIQVANMPACLILPSQDQPAEMRKQSAVIVQYPSPVVIGGTTYPYFILWADQDHIGDISRTLSFVYKS